MPGPNEIHEARPLEKSCGFQQLSYILVKHFEELMDLIKEDHSRKVRAGRSHQPVVLWWWCQAGRHRSYALLIFFLMWAAHVHDHVLVEALLSTRLQEMQRDAKMMKAADSRSPNAKARMVNKVYFGDLVEEWQEFLNYDCPDHCLS